MTPPNSATSPIGTPKEEDLHSGEGIHAHAQRRAAIQATLRNAKPQDIAIIGMACRIPRADSPEVFWEILAAGKETITRWSDEEMLADGADPAQLKLGEVLPWLERRIRSENPTLFNAPLRQRQAAGSK
jgi:hypothetical protein